jgi:hypothetical protein
MTPRQAEHRVADGESRHSVPDPGDDAGEVTALAGRECRGPDVVQAPFTNGRFAGVDPGRPHLNKDLARFGAGWSTSTLSTSMPRCTGSVAPRVAWGSPAGVVGGEEVEEERGELVRPLVGEPVTRARQEHARQASRFMPRLQLGDVDRFGHRLQASVVGVQLVSGVVFGS